MENEPSEHSSYKIGEAARRSGVSKDTIRYYEKRGIISKPQRRRSGYRIFTKHHIKQLQFVKRSQELGFTLREIKELLELRRDGNTDCSTFKEEAEEKHALVAQKIKHLNQIKQTLAELIDSCSGEGAKEDCPILRALEGKNNVLEELDS